MAYTLSAIEPRPAPIRTDGLMPWLRHNLFGDIPTSIATLVLGALLLWIVPQLFDWAVLRATTVTQAEACRAR